MDLERRFRTALDDLDAGGTELLPTRLVMAAAHVLGAAGASLSLLDGELRIPLGASDEAAAVAESLQFTVGDGPCMEAIATGTVIDAPAAVLRERWGVLAEAWDRGPGYQSAVSVPLSLPGQTRGALNVFQTDESGGAGIDPVDLTVVGLLISLLLTGHAASEQGATLLEGPLASRRSRTWIAVGMVMGSQAMTSSEALDRLRSYGYARDLTLDRVVDLVLGGGVLVDALTA